MALQPIDIAMNVLDEFGSALVKSVPRLLSGLLFLTLAWLGIKTVLRVLRGVLDRAYPAEEDMIVDLSVVVIGGLLCSAQCSYC